MDIKKAKERIKRKDWLDKYNKGVYSKNEVNEQKKKENEDWLANDELGVGIDDYKSKLEFKKKALKEQAKKK